MKSSNVTFFYFELDELSMSIESASLNYYTDMNRSSHRQRSIVRSLHYVHLSKTHNMTYSISSEATSINKLDAIKG